MSSAKALRTARSALNRLLTGSGVSAEALVGGAKAQVASAMTMQRTRGLSVVSRRSANYGAGMTGSQTADTFALTSRIRHENKTNKPLVGVALFYAHWAPAGGTEANTAQDWLVKAAIEPVNGDELKRQNVYTAGQAPWKLSRRGACRTDEIAMYLPAGGYLMERSGFTTTGANGSIPRHQIALGGTTGFGLNTGEGSGTSDVVTGTSLASQNTSPGPSATLLLGRTADGTITPSICVWGDSTGVGTDDQQYGNSAGGWPTRACVNRAGGNVSIAGERLQQQVDASTSFTRREIARWHTNILGSALINDVNQGRTIAQMKADVLAQAYWAMSQGIHYIQATCTPLVTFTDGGFDPAAQTLHANSANRIAVNQWLRDATGTGFRAQANASVAAIEGAGTAYMIDPCKAIEVNQANVLTTDGGYYKGAEGGTIFDSGTATSGTVTVLTDTGKAWAVNQHAGKVLHIVSGPGAGESHSIQTNTATALTVGISFSTAITSASVYRIIDSNCVDGIHQSTGGHTRIAAAVRPDIEAIVPLP